MQGPTRIPTWSTDRDARHLQLLSREWLVTAGDGSYASGTVGMVPTRRHHGLLVANLPAPFGRTLSMSQLREEVTDQAGRLLGRLWGIEHTGEPPEFNANGKLMSFQLESGLPQWSYQLGDIAITRQLVMPHHCNTVCVRYTLVSGSPAIRVRLRPMISFRGHNDRVDSSTATKVSAQVCGRPGGESSDTRLEFSPTNVPFPLRMVVKGQASSWQQDPLVDRNCWFRVESFRGYDHTGDLPSEGYVEASLTADNPLDLIASHESWSDIDAICHDCLFTAERERRQQLLVRAQCDESDRVGQELILAADAFLIRPAPRQVDQPDLNPTTVEPPRRSCIAGYPWFTDWGRDTMISLPGLTLATGRHEDARNILLTFADYVRDGLIPNLFPEGGQQGMYHTADATLWFFQAIDEYVEASADESLIVKLLPRLTRIIQAHLEGTRFGIGVDKSDGLLRQGQADVQLTWMDAKVDDWVVTPRRGKAVEINALWYNALRLYCGWLDQFGETGSGARLRPWLKLMYRSFNQRFWYSQGGYLYDVVDGDEGNSNALRPNQLFAISLRHPVLARKYWPDVVETVQHELLTPVGLRSLAADDEHYRGDYCGDVWQRDAAYHQGTVWAWLIGPFVRAWCRTYPERTAEATRWLSGLEAHLNEACTGQISEIFEGDEPFSPRGCFAQAWSVAELLQARRIVAGDHHPGRLK